MSDRYVVYVRRSLKREGDADVSDETQEAVSRDLRRIFRELSTCPFSEVSDRLNAQGVLRPASGSWTADPGNVAR